MSQMDTTSVLIRIASSLPCVAVTGCRRDTLSLDRGGRRCTCEVLTQVRVMTHTGVTTRSAHQPQFLLSSSRRGTLEANRLSSSQFCIHRQDTNRETEHPLRSFQRKGEERERRGTSRGKNSWRLSTGGG